MELIIQSIEAHREYVLNHIKSEKDQSYYNDMINTVISILQTYYNDPSLYLSHLLTLETVFKDLQLPRFSFSNEIKYKKLALEHVIDVIFCIHKRFGYAQS